MAEKVNGRIAFADLLRVLAILAVITLQITGAAITSVPVATRSWDVLNVYNALSRWCVPVFAMLSGMFMLDPKHSLTIPRLCFHNGLHILVALLFWSVVYAMVDLICTGGAVTWSRIGSALWAALTGHTHYHLWFLYMILGLYLVTPILRAFVRGARRSDYHWFFLIAFLWASLLPWAFRVWPNTTEAFRTWYYNMDVHLVLGFVGYFVAGYYLREFTLSRLAEALIYVLGICGTAVTILGTRWASLSAGSFSDLTANWFAPNLVLESVAVVVLFRYVLGISEERSRRQRISRIAGLVFGVYLVHDFFLILLRFLHISALSFNPIAAVPVLTALVFLCSLVVSWLISKVPFVGRWLI